ncbi:hypothetical protein N7535_003073 [Penicillium sp. DV-2018c]|nr:hypothetical protein N7461_001235 [Penicillium sp. DV-2018c]KAJ5576147.1 hypothetical protein N7535_003073 [Penicillium sp. DV-2018c]
MSIENSYPVYHVGIRVETWEPIAIDITVRKPRRKKCNSDDHAVRTIRNIFHVNTEEIHARAWGTNEILAVKGLGKNSIISMENEHGFMVCNVPPDLYKLRELTREFFERYNRRKAPVFRNEPFRITVVLANDGDKIGRFLLRLVGRGFAPVKPWVEVFDRGKVFTESKGHEGTCDRLFPFDEEVGPTSSWLCKEFRELWDGSDFDIMSGPWGIRGLNYGQLS